MNVQLTHELGCLSGWVWFPQQTLVQTSGSVAVSRFVGGIFCDSGAWDISAFMGMWVSLCLRQREILKMYCLLDYGRVLKALRVEVCGLKTVLRVFDPSNERIR